MKKLKIIAIWMMFLIVTLPFYSSSVFAQFNGNSKFNESMDLDDLRTKYGVRGVKGIDIDAECFEKNAEDNSVIEIMNNQVVHIIESIFLILYLINTVINAIDLVYRTVGLIIGYISQPCFGFFFLADGFFFASASAASLSAASLAKRKPRKRATESALSWRAFSLSFRAFLSFFWVAVNCSSALDFTVFNIAWILCFGSRRRGKERLSAA